MDTILFRKPHLHLQHFFLIIPHLLSLLNYFATLPNQADKQQQLESKKQEALNAVVEAYSDLESKLKSIRWIFQSYSDEYNAIITPYREKKQQEEVEKLAAQQAAEEEAAEKEKKVHKICLTVAIVATLIVSIILIIVGASMDAMGVAMAMLLFVAPLLGVCFYWLASPIVVTIMYR